MKLRPDPPSGALLFAPGSQRGAFVPTMPDDVFAQIVGAASDSRAWSVLPPHPPCPSLSRKLRI